LSRTGFDRQAVDALIQSGEFDIPLENDYNNSHKDFPKSGETLGQTRASAAHNSEIVYESRYIQIASGSIAENMDFYFPQNQIENPYQYYDH
jgi:hypothetical protein